MTDVLVCSSMGLRRMGPHLTPSLWPPDCLRPARMMPCGWDSVPMVNMPACYLWFYIVLLSFESLITLFFQSLFSSILYFWADDGISITSYVIFFQVMSIPNLDNCSLKLSLCNYIAANKRFLPNNVHSIPGLPSFDSSSVKRKKKKKKKSMLKKKQNMLLCCSESDWTF